jgi:hypothetical protein
LCESKKAFRKAIESAGLRVIRHRPCGLPAVWAARSSGYTRDGIVARPSHARIVARPADFDL